MCRKCQEAHPVVSSSPHATPEEQVEADRVRIKSVGDMAALKLKYGAALKTIERLELEREFVGALKQGVAPLAITARAGSGTSEATPVAVASDWHIEEEVGAEVGGLNVHNLEIAEKRAKQFFTSVVRLTRLLNQDVKISQMVLALLGDFITNDIHGAENAETNLLTPTNAIVTAQNWLIGGIEFLLNHTKYDFILPCHSGNHGRTTQTTRFGAENGHSLEYLMYLHLAAYFRSEKRVRFQIAEGMHSYLPIYDTMIRFHHGHAVKYGGGVGGIYIPVNKAIAQWNKARHADLDVFGHFHQARDGGNFICNGSNIGYNSFALSIKADYDVPKQQLFLMDKKRGRTCTWPVLVEKA